MRLLVDENLSPQVAVLLREGGFDAGHVLELGLGGASDLEVMAVAAAKDMVVVSADSDFGTLLALGGAEAPSVVLLRSVDLLRPSAQAALLRANLPGLEPSLAAGAVVSLSPARVRIRRLPVT